MKTLILVNILLVVTSVLTDDVRLTDLDPPEAQQVIESKDTSLKYAPKVESNVPATRVLGNEPHQVLEDIYLANQYHGQDGVGGYLYGYSVPDIAKTEKKKAGGDLRGAYNYISGDGQEIKVEYWDDGSGFHQIDNVPKILPKQIEDSPEVKAAKDEHARIWAEEAERNSKPIENPYPNTQPGAYAGLGAGVGAGIATAGLRHGGQGGYNAGGQGGFAKSGGPGEQTYSASGKQGFGVAPGGAYQGNAQGGFGGQKPQGSQGGFGGQSAYGGARPGGFGAPQGASGQSAYGGSHGGANPAGSGQSAYGGSHGGANPTGSGQSAYGGANPAGSGQSAYGGSQGGSGQNAYGGAGQGAHGGSGQSAYGGSQGGSGQSAYGGSGQKAYGGAGQSAYGGSQGGSGQNAYGGSQSGSGQGGSKQPGYGGANQGSFGAAGQGGSHGGYGQSGQGQGYSGSSHGSNNPNNVDYSGQYSENKQTYARNPEEDNGDWKDEEHEEEKGPPKGFFYNFDYPVGIIVSKQGQQKRESLNNLYNTNKAAFEQQLQGGAAVHGGGSYPNYQVHS